MNQVIKDENKIKDKLKYITNNREKSEMPAVNQDPLRVCVVNEELYFRALNK